LSDRGEALHPNIRIDCCGDIAHREVNTTADQRIFTLSAQSSGILVVEEPDCRHGGLAVVRLAVRWANPLLDCLVNNSTCPARCLGPIRPPMACCDNDSSSDPSAQR